MTIIRTRFGAVDADGLATFKNTFDAHEVLQAIERIEAVRREMESVRDGLLRLHALTSGLMGEPEGESEMDASSQHEPEEVIWDLAEELSLAMQDWPDEIDDVRRTLAEMEQLMPDQYGVDVGWTSEVGTGLLAA